jgi:hypothetical protein
LLVTCNDLPGCLVGQICLRNLHIGPKQKLVNQILQIAAKRGIISLGVKVGILVQQFGMALPTNNDCSVLKFICLLA